MHILRPHELKSEPLKGAPNKTIYNLYTIGTI